MSATTLFVPDLPTHPGAPVTVEGDELKHVRAARLRPGAEIRLTDGAGHLWSARLGSLAGDRARCVLLEWISPPPDLNVELAFGIGSKQRTLWLVEKAVELGVLGLQPIDFQRSRSVSDAARSAAFWEKARRRATAALVQCGGSRLPAVEASCSLEEYLLGLAPVGGDLRIALQPGGGESLRELLGNGGGGRIRIVVGPEGGMTLAEQAACRAAGFHLATLGERVMRFETAAIAAAVAAGLIAGPVAPSAQRERPTRRDREVAS